jgi:hypothetical protein
MTLFRARAAVRMLTVSVPPLTTLLRWRRTVSRRGRQGVGRGVAVLVAVGIGVVVAVAVGVGVGTSE